MFRRAFLLAPLSIGYLSHTAVAQNCCLPVLGNDDQSVRLFTGIYWATGVMLIALLSMTSVGVVWYRLRFGDNDAGASVAEE